MRNLLIAESSESVCDDLRKLLSNDWNIYFSLNAADAINQLSTKQYDCMILSLSLSNSTGLSVLSTIFPFLPPTIIVFSSITTEFMISSAYSWGANYIFEYPVNTSKLKLALDYSIGQQLPAKLSARHLRALGARIGLDGTWCVIAAIPYLMQDPTKKLGQDVYNHVAQVCGMTDHRDVERAIRFMINSAWKKRDLSIWSHYFPTNANGDIERPKSRDFIMSILQEVM